MVLIIIFSSRFWTRNRPGDTVIEKTDDISAPKIDRPNGIIFKDIPDFDKQRDDGSFFLPGLGLENNFNEDYNEQKEGMSFLFLKYLKIENLNYDY